MECLSHLFVKTNFEFPLTIAKHHPSQMRPRSRTLTAVNLEILSDVVSKSSNLSIVELVIAKREKIPPKMIGIGSFCDTLFSI